MAKGTTDGLKSMASPALTGMLEEPGCRVCSGEGVETGSESDSLISLTLLCASSLLTVFCYDTQF
jgi:hypothetical protein